MKPKRYPYSGRIKSSTTKAIKDWSKSYSNFVKSVEKETQKSEEELREAISKFSLLGH